MKFCREMQIKFQMRFQSLLLIRMAKIKKTQKFLKITSAGQQCNKTNFFGNSIPTNSDAAFCYLNYCSRCFPHPTRSLENNAKR